MTAILEIYGNGKKINCLSKRRGYHLCSWRPSRPEIIPNVSQNFFTGVEYATSYIIKPHVETMMFQANGYTQDGLIQAENDFNDVLFSSVKYQSGKPGTLAPPYIRVKSDKETNDRWAVIHSAQFHNSANPFSQPFTNPEIPLSDELQVVFTHGPWLEAEPGNPRDGAGYNRFPYQDNDFGILPEEFSTNAIPIANFATYNKLSFVYHGSDNTNLQSGAFPPGFEIWSSPEYYTYFGSYEYSSFRNLMFSIESIPPGGAVYRPITWEYSTDVGWSPLTNVYGKDDKAGGDLTLGNELITWQLPSDIARRQVNGRFCAWVRANIGGTTTNPAAWQEPYPVSISNKNFFYVENSSPGTYGVELDLNFTCPVGANETGNNIIIGAMSSSRPDYKLFESIINYDFDENYLIDTEGFLFSGLIAEERGDGDGSGYTAMYTHQVLTPLVPDQADYDNVFFKLRLHESLGKTYHGKFRMFLRMSSTVEIASENVYVYAETYQYDDQTISPGDTRQRTLKTTDVLRPGYATSFDLGSVYLGSDEYMEQTIAVMVDLHLDSLHASVDLEFIDLILIPEDEWFAHVDIGHSKLKSSEIIKLKTASTYGEFKAAVYNADGDVIVRTPAVYPGKPLAIDTQDDIQFFVYTFNDKRYNFTFNEGGGINFWSNFYSNYLLHSVKIMGRYLSSRGDK